MDILLIILGIICLLVGIAGSILPGLAGPPFSYLGLWLIHWTKYAEFSTSFLVWTGVIMAIISVADYLLPPIITKSTGGSKYATTGSIIGMIAGIFFTPIGMLTGMLLGAFLGELFFAKQGPGNALKVALGAFGGFILGTGIKLLYCFFAMIAPFFYSI
ncbi:uncharacterized protein YqgC (DUF456 family) [Parabacteroides sp. PF5-5]|uniref:DUF456 domain-containing protein n=1 Tax=unclassified Parabacteroides TaxID=2649774 RepID=UPI00247588E1|nr:MULTISPECIES: DUF456 domain-containing protein [unclassified Parabacteroides]MDH6305952.1 uncharacterized protein YqgC (DUF456 family) [Parabacteroides sp. PH5-39]MDH6317208.1 uncharacterized protein YqgC (DUF456 family) [Parabacteroides sp. PF5-13]MDH6320664.1 uncharacterized protein YqgC (DUF456 family) [Parabacteroides sp. PH5-13]MDH6324415.1 uncharacterized protein YqgC (DUF456 family) [Parabacteroides sp. PH5-8]MDH6328393.1 uncharacterized protein YqgC (DUF456 family) [Parabacteroides 